MTVLGAVAAQGNPRSWNMLPMRAFLKQRKEIGRPELPLLGVNLHTGVTKRASQDGRPAPSEDLNGYKVVHPQDAVMNRLGKPHGSVGVSQWHGITSPAYWVLHIDRSAAHPRYIHHLLRSRHMISEYQRLGKNQPPNQFDLSWDSFRSIELPIPGLEEQRRIADFLDAETSRIELLISASERLRETLLERRSSGIVSAVSGSDTGDVMRPANLSWLQFIPAGWQEIRLGLVARMGSGHTPSRGRPNWWQNCTIPWITTGEVQQVRNDRLEELTQTREMISEVGIANSAAEIHPKGTVVLCRTASAGYSAVMGVDMATSQDFVTWTCGPRLNPYYLLWCLRAMRPYLLGRLAMGSTHKTIYVPDLQMLRIPLPPMNTQLKTVDRIRNENHQIDRLVDACNKRISLLIERRQSLITAAVTGQFDATTSGRNVIQGV